MKDSLKLQIDKYLSLLIDDYMLEKIVAKTEERLVESKRNKPLSQLKEEVSKLDINDDFPFKEALKDPEIAIIAEVKKASPSKGLIAEDFDYIKIAKDYEQAGASAISVLTESYFFKGSNDYLKEIAENVLGASAILLIVSILEDVQLKKYLDLAHDLGLSAIVETHDANEIRTAIDAGAEIICVNNRNLADFTVDIENSINLRRLVSDDIIFISESGIKTAEDVRKLKENNVDAVLIGETLMRSDDKKAMIEELKNA